MNNEEHKFMTWGDVIEANKEFADKVCAIMLPWEISLPIEIDGEKKHVNVNSVVIDKEGKPRWAHSDLASNSFTWFNEVE